MRVVSGEFKGRRLKSLKGDNTRPTTDKIKESIFNMIGPYFDGEILLDLYAGSGGLAIEGVSRGCSQAYCVDRSFEAIKIIKENIEITKAPDAFVVRKGDAEKLLKQFQQESLKFDLIFLDPPYAQEKILKVMALFKEYQLLTGESLVVCETAKEVALPEVLPGYVLKRRQTYGITEVVIYKEVE